MTLCGSRKPVPPTLACLLILAAFRLATAADRWPEFRGPDGVGVSDATGLPIYWTEQENIRWKARIHGKGGSSPVVWDNQIWLTTATEDGKQLFVLCVDCATGKVSHDVEVFYVDQPQSM